MKLIIGSDHAGFQLKEQIKKCLSKKGFQLEDVGTDSEESCDYPDFAAKVAKKVQKTKNLGIVICGTGIGACITANKFRGIRAALCKDEFAAKLAREHNDANILCLGGRTTNPEQAKKIVDAFLSAQPSKEPRHIARVNKISAIEKDNFK
jgi:ribose 5-phosphate isomerase B